MDKVRTISREEIPMITSVDQPDGVHYLGELRDFRWNDLLRDFMPDSSNFSVSWVRLRHKEVLEPHVHPIQSMMVFYAGSGEVLGDLRRPIAKNDVLVVPPGCKHGFVGGPDGLCALSIQFGDGLYTTPEKPKVIFDDEEHNLERLASAAQARREAFESHPLFQLLREHQIEGESVRRAYLAQLSEWLDARSRMQLSYRATNLELLGALEETSKRESAGRDAIFEAISSWFCHQMFVLDDVEKDTLVGLVVEPATGLLLDHARSLLEHPGGGAAYQLTTEIPDTLSSAPETLQRETPSTYARLRDIVNGGWDMVHAIAERMAEHARAESAQRATAPEHQMQLAERPHQRRQAS